MPRLNLGRSPKTRLFQNKETLSAFFEKHIITTQGYIISKNKRKQYEVSGWEEWTYFEPLSG